MINEFLNVLVVDRFAESSTVLKQGLENLKINCKVDLISDGLDFQNFLTQEMKIVPNLLFFRYEINTDCKMPCLYQISDNLKWRNTVLVCYSESLSEEIVDELFVKGANIYFEKSQETEKNSKTLNDIVTVCWQYYTSGLNTENLLMRMG